MHPPHPHQLKQNYSIGRDWLVEEAEKREALMMKSDTSGSKTRERERERGTRKVQQSKTAHK